MTAPTPNSALAYKVSFTRIGRHHDVAPLVAEADGPNHLSKMIFDYARPKLGSRDITVVLEEDMGSGWIFAGIRTASTFTIEAVEIPGPRPAPIVDHSACDFAGKQVTCDRCGTKYVCTPSSDYYCTPQGDHCCEPCLIGDSELHVIDLSDPHTFALPADDVPPNAGSAS